MLSSKSNLGEGVEKILIFLENNTRVLDVSFEGIVVDSLKSIAVGANFLHPQFKGARVYKYLKLQTLLDEEFVENVCPVDGLKYLGFYKKNLDKFQTYFRVTKDPIKFWSIANEFCKGLAGYAVQLAALPAVMPKINGAKLYKSAAKWGNQQNIRALAVTVIANDNAL